MLTLNYELGGYISLKNEFVITTRSHVDTPLINVQHYHPKVGKIDWHTHYRSIFPSDGLPVDAPRLIPSDTDIMSLIRASFRHKASCLSVILSQWGYFFFFPTRKLFKLNNLETLKKELEYVNHDFFIKHANRSLQRRVNTYIKALRRLGMDGLMVYSVDMQPREHPR